MIVIIDVDDCIMPWAERVHQECIAAGLNPDERPWTQWSQWLDYGCTEEQWREVVHSLVVPGGMYHEPPYPGAAEAVRKLYWLSHEIHLVTARGGPGIDHADDIKAWTLEWKEEFAIPGTLTFAHDKGRVAREVGATHGLDDRIENWWDLHNAEVDVYLQDQPHNRNRFFDIDHPKKRVNSVAEFVDKILEEA